MPKKQQQKILVALSGGVDSSVAAALLVRAGHHVTGAFMVNYDSGRAAVGDPNCWLPEYRDALRVAASLGIPLLKLDFTKAYADTVLSYMFREYKKGRTPNPDVLCNTSIKFGVWLEYARNAGFDALATGHYARLQLSAISYQLSADDPATPAGWRKPPPPWAGSRQRAGKAESRLLQAKDKNKDQTYFLHQLNQVQLSHALFPVGNLLKSEVRSLARKLKLHTAEKEESMGICFVGEVPMKEFLAKKVKAKKGNVVTTSGEAVGEHDGLAFYTIGQRHGFGQSGGKEPWFVVEKDFKKNVLVVGHEDDPALYKKEIVLGDMHWVSGQSLKFPLQCEVRLRHRQPLQKCRIKNQESRITVDVAEPQRAVTPGQFAVFYVNGECLGGGVII